ncbi:hypothetical protein CEUSTIGMA_g1274.t1 [Chlamydomonas eustigma]|uniref:Heterokaryon incompatibility domain-containing protein n=1 Tax=Chlamydomonas eustigma TaxID=1157962 RepID=A0A250WSM2_9CHLO|nr:hypothetical protein CEUSTIGMA_g1274.t1 [Chlamydomonas eustigma]|eukprot:GAX73823.1 hypothetical protein CEUSTIGMA_g1274.t1 [Chlamydomonas eustigma]
MSTCALNLKSRSVWKLVGALTAAKLLQDPEEQRRGNTATSTRTTTSNLVGISVDWLQNFANILTDFPTLSTKTVHVVQDFVLQCTAEHECRLIDMVPEEHVGTPTQLISHSWSQDFVQSMAALHAEFQKRWQGHVDFRMSLQPKVVPRSQEQEDELAGAVEANEELKMERKKMVGYYVWIDLLCINQHDREPVELSVINRLISVIGRTVMITDHTATDVFIRLWVCYEAWTTIKLQRSLLLVRLPEPRLEVETPTTIRKVYIRDEQDIAEEIARLSPPNLSIAKASSQEDAAMLLQSFRNDVASHRVKVRSLKDIGNEILKATAAALVKEWKRATLVQQVNSALTHCSLYTTKTFGRPTFSEIQLMQTSLRAVIAQHYPEEGAKLVTGDDPEGEVWQSMIFLIKIFEDEREEGIWSQELRRYAASAQTSFSTRFSSTYVDDLLKKAGSSDIDLKKLSLYVQGQCRYR